MSRRKAILAVLVVLVVAAAGTAIGLAVEQSSGSTTPSRSFAVPARVQRTIEHGYAQLAYLPTQLPSGLRYASSNGVRGFEFSLSFSKPGSASDELEFSVVAADCGGQDKPMHSFAVNGVDVSWSGTFTEQHAWRCVTRHGTSLVVQASRSVEGDANPLAGPGLTPKQQRHALELAQVVASAEPLP